MKWEGFLETDSAFHTCILTNGLTAVLCSDACNGLSLPQSGKVQIQILLFIRIITLHAEALINYLLYFFLFGFMNLLQEAN